MSIRKFYTGARERLRTTSPWILLKTTVEEWNADNASRLAAALAYYVIFSMAPILVIGFAITGIVFERQAAQDRIVDQIARYVNSQEVAELIESMVRRAGATSTNVFVTIAGVIALLYAASSVFAELKDALNLIWDVPPKPTKGLRHVILNRLLMLVMVIISGFFLLASFVVETVMAAANTWISIRWSNFGMYSQGVSFLLFFLVTVLVFALIYKYVPDIRIAWQDVWIGALATALLFSLGRLLISSFFANSTAGSSFGVAGALGLLVIWIFYSAQLFFLGAEFTQVYGRTYGSRWREYVLLPELEDETLPPEEDTQDAPLVTIPTPIPEPAPVPVAVPVPVETPAPVAARIPLKKRMRTITQPVGDLVIAVGIIGTVSIYNLLRQPFRK